MSPNRRKLLNAILALLSQFRPSDNQLSDISFLQYPNISFEQSPEEQEIGIEVFNL